MSTGELSPRSSWRRWRWRSSRGGSLATGGTCGWRGSACEDRSSTRGWSGSATTVRGFATLLGAIEKYHETVTRAWAERIQAAMEQTPEHGTFDAFLEAHPELLNPGLLEQHYRKETLDSPGAKAGWVPPDLEPLPRRKQRGG